jgi:hypothetical protein
MGTDLETIVEPLLLYTLICKQEISIVENIGGGLNEREITLEYCH